MSEVHGRGGSSGELQGTRMVGILSGIAHQFISEA